MTLIKSATRGRDGIMEKAYVINYDWGESWRVMAEDFEDNLPYWFKVLCRNIDYYRQHTTNELEVITSAVIWCDSKAGHDYAGIVSVGETAGYVLYGDIGASDRIEERIEKEDFI